MALLITLIGFSQMPVMRLTFSARSNIQYRQLDSVKVINRTQLCDTMLIWPDTVLHLDYQVGLKEWSLKDPSTGNIDFSPNPVTENATFGFYLPSVYPATIAISDLSGRILYQHTFKLEQGYHRFQWTSGLKGMYVLSIEYAGMISSVKVISQGNGNTRDIQIEHLGVDSHEMNFRSASSSLGFEYTTGDILLIIGYSNGIESGMVDSPKDDKDYIVQLGSNISCPGIPSFNYGGQLYPYHSDFWTVLDEGKSKYRHNDTRRPIDGK
ncbi:MAG: T9SS type A sorting domain-containing protein [Bacteroidales bacterium]|nr:T9SS type A sorting domain-containing protein [Bacteroidales bacterium]